MGSDLFADYLHRKTAKGVEESFRISAGRKMDKMKSDRRMYSVKESRGQPINGTLKQAIIG